MVKTFFRWKNSKFPTFKLHTPVRKNAISPKVFNRFSKTFLLLKDVENRYLAQKFHWRSYFSFAMVRWKLLQKGNSKFTNSKLHTVPEKNAISPKVFNRFSKTFLLLKDVENRYLTRKFDGRTYFSFAMVWWKPFFRWKNSKFPTFKLYTVSEKMLYHQKYSLDFQKLSFCWKMWKIGIWPKNFMGAAILIWQW